MATLVLHHTRGGGGFNPSVPGTPKGLTCSACDRLAPMTLSIRQIHPVFVGEVSGIDIGKPLSGAEVATIEAGMDRYAVLSSHAGAILGMPTPEARILLRDLNEHATQPAFVYVHGWRSWDLVMWDNRQMMHRVRRYDETQPRDMRRTTVAGDAQTAEQVRAP